MRAKERSRNKWAGSSAWLEDVRSGLNVALTRQRSPVQIRSGPPTLTSGGTVFLCSTNAHRRVLWTYRIIRIVPFEAGRGFEARPRLQHKGFLFPILGRFSPERFGFGLVDFSVLRDFLMGRSPHNSTIFGAGSGVAVSIVCSAVLFLNKDATEDESN
jgi:hypothetical protein